MTEQHMYEIAEQLLAESIQLTGCVRNSRRWCCEYHDGFETGMDVLIGKIMEGTRNA